jgi:hypothetical protein
MKYIRKLYVRLKWALYGMVGSRPPRKRGWASGECAQCGEDKPLEPEDSILGFCRGIDVPAWKCRECR